VPRASLFLAAGHWRISRWNEMTDQLVIRDARFETDGLSLTALPNSRQLLARYRENLPSRCPTFAVARIIPRLGYNSTRPISPPPSHTLPHGSSYHPPFLLPFFFHPFSLSSFLSFPQQTFISTPPPPSLPHFFILFSIPAPYSLTHLPRFLLPSPPPISLPRLRSLSSSRALKCSGEVTRQGIR